MHCRHNEARMHYSPLKKRGVRGIRANLSFSYWEKWEELRAIYNQLHIISYIASFLKGIFNDLSE
jgi:hypothetical protein